jgi:uncharacterized DUF497 family protein
MRFEWDEEKNRRNQEKHLLSFERAKKVFQDPHAFSVPDEYELEERWQSLGLVDGVVILLVVHTIREEDDEEVFRIISARKATHCEREVYAENAKSWC